ncbi:MAG: lipoprotein [Pseudomonadota bacterium]
MEQLHKAAWLAGLALVIATNVATCGQKGPLVLPERTQNVADHNTRVQPIQVKHPV